MKEPKFFASPKLISRGIEIKADPYLPENLFVLAGYKKILVMDVESGKCWLMDGMADLESKLLYIREEYQVPE